LAIFSNLNANLNPLLDTIAPYLASTRSDKRFLKSEFISSFKIQHLAFKIN